MPSTSCGFFAIHFLLPMMTLGICIAFSLVDTMLTKPPFFSAMVTSPGVQVTTPSTQCFSLLPLLTFLSSVQKPLTYFCAASM